MDKNISIKFLNHILNHKQNIDDHIIEHNQIFNNQWNNNKLDIKCLIEKLFNMIKPIISTNQQNQQLLQYNKHIKWDPIFHKYPISYLYYIRSISTQNGLFCQH